MASQNGHGNAPTLRTNSPTATARKGAPAAPRKRSYFWVFFLLFLLGLGALVAYVLAQRAAADKNLNAVTEQMATSTVLVIHPDLGSAQVHLTLPGTVNAYTESHVYAQVSGYIKRWLVDIGQSVTAGELMAEIETPVTDQQLRQSQESVKQAEANLNLSKITADRYNDLLKSNAVSQQDADNQNASVKVQEANLSAAQAFQTGIEKTEAFKQVQAPFAGVVTARKIDTGDYVSSSGQTVSSSSGPNQTGSPNQELFRVAQIDLLRVYVNVPARYASVVVPGVVAKIELASAPNRSVSGKLVRTANAIDPNSQTLLVEIDIDNTDGKLFPGGYAQVHFDLETDHPPLVIPGNSLIFRAQGPQVGVVGDDNRVHLRDIKIGRDLGTKLEITDGLKNTDAVILNPSDSLFEGQKVQVDTNTPAQK